MTHSNVYQLRGISADYHGVEFSQVVWTDLAQAQAAKEYFRLYCEKRNPTPACHPWIVDIKTLELRDYGD